MALWFDEVFEDDTRFGLKVVRTIHTETSPYQRIAIMESERFGRFLTLDDIFMTSEGDEFYYHEMIVHPALVTAPRAKRVLIIGGGDGGTAREVLRHPEVETCVMVEIDEAVVRACQAHLPTIGTAWNDPRLDLRFDDGIQFVKEGDVEPFDVVLLDGSDPVGPAEGLFNRSFYEGVRRVLAPDGVFALQSESPTLMETLFFDTQRTLREVFPKVIPYMGSVILYGAGLWTWTLCTSDESYDPQAIVEERLPAAETTSRYYNRDIHRGCFALPTFVREGVQNR